VDRQAAAGYDGAGGKQKTLPLADGRVRRREVSREVDGANPMYACLHAPGNLPLLIECARGFSPHIETNPPDTVVLDARGLE
jgi:hypothetical protein